MRFKKEELIKAICFTCFEKFSGEDHAFGVWPLSAVAAGE